MFYSNYTFSHTQVGATDTTDIDLTDFMPNGGYIQGIFNSEENITEIILSLVNGATISPIMILDGVNEGLTRKNALCVPVGSTLSLRFTSTGTPATGNYTIMINYFAFPENADSLTELSAGNIAGSSATIFTNLSANPICIKSFFMCSIGNASTAATITYDNTTDTVVIPLGDLSTLPSIFLPEINGMVLNQNDELSLQISGSTANVGYLISGNYVE